MNTSGVTLHLLDKADKADKEILKLPRTVKGAFFDFQHKFKANPHVGGVTDGLVPRDAVNQLRSRRSRALPPRGAASPVPGCSLRPPGPGTAWTSSGTALPARSLGPR